MIDLDWLESDIYVVLFYGFEGDSRVDLSNFCESLWRIWLMWLKNLN